MFVRTLALSRGIPVIESVSGVGIEDHFSPAV